jgi:hypothetical protein
MSHMAKKRVLIGATFFVVIAATSFISWNARRGGTGIPDEAALVRVVVSTEDIPIGARLQPLLDRGVFKEIYIPRYALVAGSIRDLEQLEDANLFTRTVIVKNEQILTFRLDDGSLI